MEINGKTLDAFRVDFTEAVKDMEIRYGVKIRLGTITYSDERFEAKLTVINGADSAEAERNEFDAFAENFSHLGFRKGMYNVVVVGGDGKRYAVCGFDTKAKKYKIRIRDVRTGERIRCTANFIRRILDEYYVDSIS